MAGPINFANRNQMAEACNGESSIEITEISEEKNAKYMSQTSEKKKKSKASK